MEAPSSCEEGEAPLASAEAVPSSASGMRRNDEKLREMLALAAGCLRSQRLPGETRERDLFERWDAEVAAVQAAAREAEGTSSSPSRASPPSAPVPPTPEGL